MKADSGASNTYLQPNHVQYLQNLRTLINGLTATLPDNKKIQASTQGFLSLSDDLRPEALVYPSLNNESLLSIGQLCDKGCVAIIDKYKLYIIQNGKQILAGTRNFNDGLWDVPFKK